MGITAVPEPELLAGIVGSEAGAPLVACGAIIGQAYSVL
jgi:hypothetical protein